MAKPGPKGKPPILHAVDGTHRKHRHGELPEDTDIENADSDLDPPKRLKARHTKLWDQFIRHTPWLTEYDVPAAYIWVQLTVEFEKNPEQMVAARIAQIRALSSELGLSYLVAGKSKSKASPNDSHFD